MLNQSVVSSCLYSIHYNCEEKTLIVEFHSGRVYRYSGVPKEVFEGLMKAESLGRYFNNEIRDEYRCTKIH